MLLREFEGFVVPTYTPVQAYCGVGAEMRVTQPVVDVVFRKLGGREVLSQTVDVTPSWCSTHLARLVLIRVGRFIVPEHTQRHRNAKRQPLTVEESDRVVRLTRIQALTEDVFGDAQKANRWLRENLAILDGKPPLEIARTEFGARVVEQMLAKIDWGAAA